MYITTFRFLLFLLLFFYFLLFGFFTDGVNAIHELGPFVSLQSLESCGIKKTDLDNWTERCRKVHQIIGISSTLKKYFTL